MTHDEMIAILQAHRDGKEIEVYLAHDDDWQLFCSAKGDYFVFPHGKYRIKPEKKRPIEVCMFVTAEGYVLPSIDEGVKARLAKFREVLE